MEYSHRLCVYKYNGLITSPNAPLPITFSGTKSSTPNLERLSRRNSVSLTACCKRFSAFVASDTDSSLSESSSLLSLEK